MTSVTGIERPRIGDADDPPDETLSVLGRLHFRDHRQERMFLSSASFFVAFAVTRAITHGQRKVEGPFRWVPLRPRRRRHHHLVYGILSLLGTGYAWLAQAGMGVGRSSRWGSRSTAILYGAGSAVTLDEFALWLNLEDVYWAREGRESVDAVILFGALLSAGFWGGLFHRLADRARDGIRTFKD